MIIVPVFNSIMTRLIDLLPLYVITKVSEYGPIVWGVMQLDYHPNAMQFVNGMVETLISIIRAEIVKKFRFW